MTFGSLARTGGITTAGYAGSLTGAGGSTAGTCSNTYCHGNFQNGAAANAPSWLGGVAAASCGSCHGLPPGGTHPASTSCDSCHAGYTTTTVNAANHLNGAVDVTNMSCTSCHGDGTRASVAGADLNQAAAPPVDTLGAVTGVRVGTHVAHVNPAATGAVYKPVACTECHTDNAGNNAHSNNVVNVTFTAATGANLKGFTATFVQGNGTTTQTTCATYCHGSSLDATTTRGLVATWTWNGAPADCASCHRSPPGTANHHNAAALTTCAKCHSGTVDGTGVVNVAGGLHVNGSVDTANLGCTTCHGNATLVASGLQDPNVAAAPTGTGAPDTYGNTDGATASGVGVHAAHVLGTRSRPVQCNACHTVPGTQIHKTGAATAGTVALANLATTGGIANAAYAGAGGTCSNVYCHGNFAGGAGAVATPGWTTAGTLSCTSCHGAPPALNATSAPPGQHRLRRVSRNGLHRHHRRRGHPRRRRDDAQPLGLHALPRRPDPDRRRRDLRRRRPWLQRHRRRHHRRDRGDRGRRRRPRGAPHRHEPARDAHRLRRVPHGSRHRRRRPTRPAPARAAPAPR